MTESNLTRSFAVAERATKEALKAVEKMTAAEVRTRVLEIQIEEERCWQNVSALRLERAELELQLYRLEGGKK